MKSFKYTAQNELGEKVTGNIESSGFDDALEKIRKQGLQVMAIEEGKWQEQLIDKERHEVFEAILPDAEELEDDEELGELGELEELETQEHHTVEVEIESKDSKDLKDAKDAKDLKEEDIEPIEEVSRSQIKKEESILFSRKANIAKQSKDASGDDLENLDQEIEAILSEKAELISVDSQDRLEHLRGKIDLLRDNPNSKRLKNLKREFKRVKKSADKDIEKNEQRKWDEYEKKAPGKKVESYDDFEKGAEKKESQRNIVTNEKRSWYKVIDEPDEDNDKEVLIKQQYESVWNEAQRFAGVLFAFYLLTFFIAYYMKRVGIEDNFLVRIYDTTLFKQLIIVLFTGFALLTLRKDFLPKKLQSDVAVLLVAVIVSFMVFG
jgi:hypothetical protein